MSFAVLISSGVFFFQLAHENRLRTLAFCVINSDKRGYPKEEGAHIALRTIRRSMEHFKADFDRIVFCVETESDLELYGRIFKLYFPRNDAELKSAAAMLPEDCGNEWGETVIEERTIRVGALVGSSSFSVSSALVLIIFRRGTSLNLGMTRMRWPRLGCRRRKSRKRRF